MNALHGSYLDPSGCKRKVTGDMTKMRWVPGLSAAVRRLLSNIEHTSRRLPGTQETRRLMRFDTNAHRIRYGVPIFVTFSQDEAHNLSMIRFSRVRRNDLVLISSSNATGAATFAQRQMPTLCSSKGNEVWSVSISDLIASLPDHDARRAILARDSLAAVDGFRTLVLLIYEYLFGMRICIFWPDCNNGRNSIPCQDLFGSNAFAKGVIFGRIDAGHTSIEVQK